MKSLGTENRDETTVREERPGLDVLLMYEDFSTGLRARRLLGVRSAVQDIQRRAGTQTVLLEEMLHRLELSSYRDRDINE